MEKKTTPNEQRGMYVAPLCMEYEINVSQVICTSGENEKVNDTNGEW